MLESAEVQVGESVRAWKVLTPDEWYFACHYPGDPMMPGVLQLETIGQAGALLLGTMPENYGRLPIFSRASNIAFYRKIVPGAELRAEVQLQSFRRGLAKLTGVLYADDERACTQDFVLVFPNESIKPKTND